MRVGADGMKDMNDRTKQHESLGLCVGASTLSLVRTRMNGQGAEVLWTRSEAHEGNPRALLRGMLASVPDLPTLRVAATGRKFRSQLALSTIPEPEAVELAAAHVLPENHPYRTILSAGAENFMVLHLNDANRIEELYTGNRCAAGTGEFFMQQLRRMDISLDDAAGMELGETPHPVSGRCSVFCKSDCTHALNKGVAKDHVVSGLAKMMAGKLVELFKNKKQRAAMLVGGCAAIPGLVHHLKQEIEELFVPEEAGYFEALGAGLWALENETLPCDSIDALFMDCNANASFHPPLSAFMEQVDFKAGSRSEAEAGDRCLMGLDVGSTTTKGVILRRADQTILASEYLRTNGDPVGASRRVYQSLADQIAVPLQIEGIGVTGSGRQIAGLHAMTDGVINEIIAHAAAAVHFDPQVDTIIEIGGQDAKYTHITNGVPSDYVMNEACSAGTGSFLEEAAKESLGLDVTAISEAALQAEAPPNFSDQCAAFIGSDIKRSVQEGIGVPDIVAGLVYSICMNYNNRVRGNRPVGDKIFIQGGVCYNKAVPAAMAALTGKPVVVPPDPGLMGALGVALEVGRRMEQGLLAEGNFELQHLADRALTYLDPFECKGGKEGCDHSCEVARIRVNEKIYPFGGICNRYDNLVHHRENKGSGLDLVIARERRLFRDLAPGDERPTVGLNRSLLSHTYFPLYNRFFSELGFRVVLPDGIDPHGADQQGAAFCYPVELAHGHMAQLMKLAPDFLFLPHLRGIPSGEKGENSCTCVFVQGEPYYLRAAFPGIDKDRILVPYFDFSLGIENNLAAFEEVATRLGADRGQAKRALKAAMAVQEECFSELRALGAEALRALEDDAEAMAVVLFGRPYNAFTGVANKGIPAKLASRGVRVIPFDMLPLMEEKLGAEHNMYWGMGRNILTAAQYVKKHPRLFGTYITNFSCGPDSFILGYFQGIMGRKPSLTLELDNHTADAGIETRIEAFLDIVQYYRQIEAQDAACARGNGFRPALLEQQGKIPGVRTSSGEWLPLTDPRVCVTLPSMSDWGTSLLAKSFARVGVHAIALPPADEATLNLGRGNTSCKECLPLQTTVGSLLRHLEQRPAEEVTLYFMASTDGPCRFGQYEVFSKSLIKNRQFENVALLSLTTQNGYSGFGTRFNVAAWRACLLGDLLDEIWATLLAGAVDREAALAIFKEEHARILEVIPKDWKIMARQLKRSAHTLSKIPLKQPYHEIPKLSLVGEIYVRNDPISLQQLVERMADQGFIVRRSKVSEWVKYLDWIARRHIEDSPTRGFWFRLWMKRYWERQIRKCLAPSGLIYVEDGKVEPIMEAGSRHVSPLLTGEAVLTVGAALHEILTPSCGVLSIGPFGCMPSRLAEAVLNDALTTTEKRNVNGHDLEEAVEKILSKERKLPFLAIETDGTPFPPIIEARLESFCLQAKRLNDEMQGD
jgi:predicted CoA-substrate-specific enzyme activase